MNLEGRRGKVSKGQAFGSHGTDSGIESIIQALEFCDALEFLVFQRPEDLRRQYGEGRDDDRVDLYFKKIPIARLGIFLVMLGSSAPLTSARKRVSYSGSIRAQENIEGFDGLRRTVLLVSLRKEG